MKPIKKSCKEASKEIKCRLKEKIELWVNEGHRPPRLVILQVGNDPASNSYIKGKKKDCKEINIDCSLFTFEDDVREDILKEFILLLNENSFVDGIIVQLPLPSHIDPDAIANAITPEKDVDGFNRNSQFQSCTPKGVINYLCIANKMQLDGLKVLVIGRSKHVGKPLADMLLEHNATVTIAHSHTVDLEREFENKDLIITCIDKISYFGSDYIKCIDADANVIDIGLGIDASGKLCGNFDPAAVAEFHGNGAITSGKGGVGLLTRAALLDNVYEAYVDHMKDEGNG